MAEQYQDAVVGWVHCQMCGVKAPSGTVKKVQGTVLCSVCQKRVGKGKILRCKVCGTLDVESAMIEYGGGSYCAVCAENIGT